MQSHCIPLIHSCNIASFRVLGEATPIFETTSNPIFISHVLMFEMFMNLAGHEHFGPYLKNQIFSKYAI